MGELIIEIIFLLPLYGILIWTYFTPKESALLLQRWKYKEEPELSENYIRYIKFASISSIVVITFATVAIIVTSPFIRLLLLFMVIVYFIMAGHKFLKSLE